MTNHCIFRELTVMGPAELSEHRWYSKASTLELYSPYASVPAEVKQAVLAEVGKLAGSPASRAVGALVGMAVADATGAPFEFMPARDVPCVPMIDPNTLDILDQVGGRRYKPFNKFQLSSGQWSDDTAMGLCLADSLLENQGYNGSDVRVKFHPTGAERSQPPRGTAAPLFQARRHLGVHLSLGGGSVGLGGNVSKSLAAMLPNRIPPPRYEAPNEDAGNGSLMRLAAVPVFYARSPAKAAEVSAESSRSTHPGPIAAAACAFLGFAIARAIVRDSASMTAKDRSSSTGWFRSSSAPGCPGRGSARSCGGCAAASRGAGRRPAGTGGRTSCRSRGPCTPEAQDTTATPAQRGTLDLTASDGLAIALWGFYSTSSFHEAVVRCVNCLGDADTTAAIRGHCASAAAPSPCGVEQGAWP
ncbi:unnamed protein product, partial [Prorocentrum cordatum]